MSDHSKIEWTDASWNPIRARYTPEGGPARKGWGCVKVSPGCANCYAERVNMRLGNGRLYASHSQPEPAYQYYLDEKALRLPLTWRWRRPRRVFVCSMTDLFGEWVTDHEITRVFNVMRRAPQHTFQVLTKRSARMLAWFRSMRYPADRPMAWEGAPWPLPNVWLGVSVEDQLRAEERIPDLLLTPAAVRWVSAEPLLGPVNLWPWFEPELMAFGEATGKAAVMSQALHWVVAGGESGPGARAMHPDWAKLLRNQCADAGVPFFFKQWGAWAPNCLCGKAASCLYVQRPEPGKLGLMFRCGKKAAGRILDGRTWDEYPDDGTAKRRDAASTLGVPA